jgi:hypothetical protein
MKSMNNNPLSDLDSMLKRAGHETWGWRIYRCTYNSDDDWTEFMKQLKNTFQQMLDDYGATDDQAKQQIWTVVEDRERLENATKSDVRRMFKDWVNSPEAAAEQPNARGPLSRVGMARYLYCMHVDEESLRSVLDDSDDWHVNIIERDWVPEEESSDAEESDDDEEVSDGEEEADIWPEIEGCTEEDVGWTKASEGILIGRYVDLCDRKFWYTYYMRPPRISD